jgi:Tol biopolymer transport system component
MTHQVVGGAALASYVCRDDNGNRRVTEIFVFAGNHATTPDYMRHARARLAHGQFNTRVGSFRMNSTKILLLIKHTILALIVLIFSLGCQGSNESRLSHYKSGGSFFGGGPAISPGGDFLAYSTPRTGNGDIYQVKLDGINSVRLTSSPLYDCDPHYALDGSSIVFVREIGGQGDLWLMKSDGSGQSPLTTNTEDEGGPKFASNNSVVFWRTVADLKSAVGTSRARELWLIDFKTGIETRITDNTVEDVFPEVSPDGKYIAYTRDSQIWIRDLVTSVERNLGAGSDGTFSPDGLHLGVVAGRFGRQIDVINLDGSGRRTIYSKNKPVSHPAYLPDGTGVLFLEEPKAEGVGNLLLVDLKNLSVRTIVDTR